MLIGEPTTFSQQKILSSNASFKNSVFMKCNSPKINGSAIFTSYPLTLYNCQISQCKSSFGAIFCENAVSLQYCTFSNNNAASQASCLTVRTNSRANTSIISCYFLSSRSNLFGAVFRESHGHCTVKYDNFTKNHASSCVGSCEIGRGGCVMRFANFEKNSAAVHNGNLVVRQTQYTNINSCNFVRNSHKTKESKTGAALLVYINPDESVLSHCFFINNNRDGSYTLRVYFGKPMLILDTCFTGSVSEELFSDPDESFLTDVFGGRSCKLNHTESFDIGYIEGRKEKISTVSSVMVKEIQIVCYSCMITTCVCLCFVYFYRKIRHSSFMRRKKGISLF